MNNRRWHKFKNSIDSFIEGDALLKASIRNFVVIFFVFTVINTFNVKVLGSSVEGLTESQYILSKEIPSSGIIADDLIDNEDDYDDDNYNSSVIEFPKNAGGGVTNIKIFPEYDAQRNKIVLNVSWDKPTGYPPVQHYDFKILPNSSYPECRPKLFEIIKRNKTLTSFYLPPLLNPYEVYAGCSYIISVIADRSRGGKFKEDVTYAIPECVGKKCSCRHLSPRVDNISIVEFAPGKLNISWEIDHKETNETTFNITKILFEYRPVPTKDRFLSPFASLATPNVSLNLDYFILEEAYSIFTLHQPYELQATFYNTFDCKVINYTNFTVNTIELHDAVQLASKGFTWEIALLTIIVAMVILAVAYFVRRNRLILKEIMHDPCSLRFMRSSNGVGDRAASYIVIPAGSKREQEALNTEYIEKEILDGEVDHYEFPRSHLTILKKIGEGTFGEVFLARARNIDNKTGYTFVAVKSLRERAPSNEKTDFLKEISILKEVGDHPNIVKIFGCCQLKEPYLMIMEFVPCADLRKYLLGLRDKWKTRKNKDDSTPPVFADTSDGSYILPNVPRDRMVSEGPSLADTEYTNFSSEGFPTPTDYYVDKVESTLDHTELQNFALQIAKGMEHLEKIPIAHRDLAARNILINEFKVLKVSDFGMSRIGPYINSNKSKMPLRWMSLESIESNFYDSKSDVWSFAVVLWEIGTLGAFPYDKVMDGMVLPYLQNGNRLERPEVCTDELYSLMLKCWSRDPDLRPSFKELVDLLDLKKKNIYVDFSQLNPLYIFPPSIA